MDFVAIGNSGAAAAIADKVYTDPAMIAKARLELQSGDVAQFGSRVPTMAANVGIGWFAILLGRMIWSDTRIPDYILDAIFQAHISVTTEIFASVLTYRLK